MLIYVKGNAQFVFLYNPPKSSVNVCLFFLSGFFFIDTDDSQDSRGREGPSFIPLYHFHPLTNIETFICNFACEMTITYF